MSVYFDGPDRVRPADRNQIRPWRPRGRLFPLSLAAPPAWLGGYAALPFAVPGKDGRARVFFSGRDAENRSHIGAVELDLDELRVPTATLAGSPLVAPGAPGTFDDAGCSMSCVVTTADRWYLYYTGWNLRRAVPFGLGIGLATSDDRGRTFQKFSSGPLMDRHPVDPILCASPSVLVESGIWRMWYVSGVGWDAAAGGGWRPRYLLKYAESTDGLDWRRQGRVAIGFADESEYAMGRPHVVKDGDRYRMWFCVRGSRYRIACAESDDGLAWERHEGESLAAPARSDWDAEMQAYPMVFRDDDRHRWVMLYNGNGYGATGFGAATRPVVS